MISIIIPVYNAERYLPQCLGSIISQTHANLEIICVNDGSADNSLALLRRYAPRDNRIVIIDKQSNQGLEMARYSGLQVARGKYIMHVDADDWLEGKDTLEKMYLKAEETGADYVEIGMQRVFDRHSLLRRKSVPSVTGEISRPELFDRYYISFFGINRLSVNIWGKLYRHDTLKKADIRPMGFTMGEDLIYNLQLFPHLSKICILPHIGYNYRFGGMTSRYNPHLLPDLKKMYRIKERLARDNDYLQAIPYIRIELKNILKTDICQRIIYHTGDSRRIISDIEVEMRDPLWDEIVDVSPEISDDPFFTCLKDRDAHRAYEICRLKVHDDRWNRRLKRLISWLCTKI